MQNECSQHVKYSRKITKRIPCIVRKKFMPDYNCENRLEPPNQQRLGELEISLSIMGSPSF